MLQKNSMSSISDLRFKTEQVFKMAKISPVVVLHRTTPKGVLMSMEKYGEMLSILEDYYISLKAEEYENENKDSISWTNQKDVKKIFR